MTVGPADHYGETGLLAGDASGVRLTTLTPVSVYELAGEELAQNLASHIEVLQAFNRVVTFRQEAIKPPEPEMGDDLHAHGFKTWLSDGMHHRYGIAASK